MKIMIPYLLLVVLLALTAANEDIKFKPFDGDYSSAAVNVVKRESPPNPTVIGDHHIYYKSYFVPPGSEADSLWFELSHLAGSGPSTDPRVSETPIQDLYRYYQIWPLEFNFPFFGHLVNSVGVTTGGFLYAGALLHGDIHLTQYIAPLQANFNPALNDTARILIFSTEDRFTVQWDQVHNFDHVQDGPFTFQVSLFPNGSIYFAYREIPVTLDRVSNGGFPVEVGLADAYYEFDLEDQINFVTIYEYARVRLTSSLNLSYSAYVINPVINCVYGNSCDSCIDITKRSFFECTWCPTLKRCSDKFDRHRQTWIIAGCENTNITTCSTALGSSQTAAISLGVIVFIILLILVLVIVVSIIIIILRKKTGSGDSDAEDKMTVLKEVDE